MGIEKKVLSVRLDEEFINELKTIAKNENRNLSNFIETVLKMYVNSKKINNEQKEQPIGD